MPSLSGAEMPFIGTQSSFLIWAATRLLHVGSGIRAGAVPTNYAKSCRLYQRADRIERSTLGRAETGDPEDAECHLSPVSPLDTAPEAPVGGTR
jgi:hypothetical protein